MNIIAKDFSMATQSYDIFLSGCSAEPRCQDCHNPEAWDFEVGKDWKQWIFQINRDMQSFKGVIKKIFIMGGEPLDQDREEFLEFIKGMKEFGKEVWLFTRFELDEIEPEVKELFDYIKCGRYLPELSTDDNIQYGVKLATSNQQIYKKGVDY